MLERKSKEVKRYSSEPMGMLYLEIIKALNIREEGNPNGAYILALMGIMTMMDGIAQEYYFNEKWKLEPYPTKKEKNDEQKCKENGYEFGKTLSEKNYLGRKLDGFLWGIENRKVTLFEIWNFYLIKILKFSPLERKTLGHLRNKLAHDFSLGRGQGYCLREIFYKDGGVSLKLFTPLVRSNGEKFFEAKDILKWMKAKLKLLFKKRISKKDWQILRPNYITVTKDSRNADAFDRDHKRVKEIGFQMS